MKGRFDLVFNPKLPIHTKITKFVSEPTSFHLHKNRCFIDKIQKHSLGPEPT